jgi:hypothetical protein
LNTGTASEDVVLAAIAAMAAQCMSVAGAANAAIRAGAIGVRWR